MWIEIGLRRRRPLPPRTVTPFTGVWIEISTSLRISSCGDVTPFTGVWIEMPTGIKCNNVAVLSHPSRVCGLKCVLEEFSAENHESHPSRVCGLKSPRRLIDEGEVPVTPFTGVWIEIERRPVRLAPPTVTPFTGVWIEISASAESVDLEVWSHPSRVCGLKLMRSPGRPLVRRHTLHGCVD